MITFQRNWIEMKVKVDHILFNKREPFIEKSLAKVYSYLSNDSLMSTISFINHNENYFILFFSVWQV